MYNPDQRVALCQLLVAFRESGGAVLPKELAHYVSSGGNLGSAGFTLLCHKVEELHEQEQRFLADREYAGERVFRLDAGVRQRVFYDSITGRFVGAVTRLTEEELRKLDVERNAQGKH